MKDKTEKLLIGRCEWCSLPLLNLPAIKAKIDTGAKTSALHAFDITSFFKEDKHWISFLIYPLQGDNKTTISCTAEVITKRNVMSSNGHIEHRYIVYTPLVIDNRTWHIELSLSNRDPLKYRMLLGRTALKNRVLIDPSRTLALGKISKQKLHSLYTTQKI